MVHNSHQLYTLNSYNFTVFPTIQNTTYGTFSADKIFQNNFNLPAYDGVPKETLVFVVDM
jgi:hypothetical protein